MPKKSPLWLSVRLQVACLGFFGCVAMYTQNACMSIATVCMLNERNSDEKTTDLLILSKDKQAVVLGAFFYGYSIPQLFIGILSQKYSAKYVMLIGMSFCTMCTLSIPLAAHTGFAMLVCVRFFIGLTASVVVPCLNVLWSRWAPQQERSVLVGGTFAGMQLGSVVAFAVSGQICAAFGWQYIFYTFGALSAVWCICWFLLIHDSPAQHPTICAGERHFIESSVVKKHNAPIEISAIPWISMLFSVPLWAAVVAQWCSGFGTFLMLTQLPTYFRDVLKLDIKSNGLYSACPYLALLIVINIATVSADYLRNYFSTTNVRRLMMILALCPQAAFLIATGYLNTTQTLTALLFLTLSSGMSGCKNAGVIVNFGELAPRYAGILSGAANSIAGTSGFIAPMVCAFLTREQTVEQWRLMFWVTGGVLVFGCIVFAVFGSAEAQSWALDEDIRGKKTK